MLKRLKSILFGGPPSDMKSEPKVKPEKDSREKSRKRADSQDEEVDEGRLAHSMPGEFERVFGRDESDPQSWLGVDLDGTLSEHTDEIDIETIGAPIPEMVARVKDWIAHGYKVKVLTARASVPEGIAPVEAWLKENNLPPLEVTNAKDLHMIELWDDRGIRVIANTGQPVGPSVLDQPEEEDSEKEQ